MLYPFYPSTLPRPEGGVECLTKAVQKVDLERRRHARHSPSIFKLVPLVSDTHASNGAPVSEPCTAMVIFIFLKFKFFCDSTPTLYRLLYSTPLLYPSTLPKPFLTRV